MVITNNYACDKLILGQPGWGSCQLNDPCNPEAIVGQKMQLSISKWSEVQVCET